MPVVTDPPILIDQSEQEILPSVQPYAFNGVFVYPSPARLYQATVSQVGADKTVMYKSLDAGQNWATVDFANSPDPNNLAPTMSKSGNKLMWVSTDVSNNLLFREFDTSTGTDLWGSAVTGGPVNIYTAPATQGFTKIFKLGNGDVWIFYSTQTGFGGWAFFYVVYSSGVWGSPQTIDNPASAVIHSLIRQVIPDPSGTYFHVTYALLTDATNIYSLKYRTITTGGSISSAATIDTGPAGRSMRPGQGVVASVRDMIVLPINNPTGNHRFGAYVGTPIAAPVWTFVPLDTDSHAGTSFDDTPFALTNSTGSKVQAWYSVQDFDVPTQNLYYSENSGSGWDAPVFYYDAIANPPADAPIDPVDQFIHFVSGALEDDDTIDIAIGLEADAVCLAYYLSSAAPPPSIICDDPPLGLQGVPYSHFFPASGGVPPYTFSIISGALPDGLVLDTTTGEVSGIPTADGTFSFTVQVEDSLGVTANVTCSITIAPLPSIICDDPPQALAGQPYSHFFPASSGTPPYSWSITAGVLPTGLALNVSTGEVSGTPTVAGTFVFTVTVTDANGLTANVTCSITVIATPGSNCPDEDVGGPG